MAPHPRLLLLVIQSSPLATEPCVTFTLLNPCPCPLAPTDRFAGATVPFAAYTLLARSWSHSC